MPALKSYGDFYDGSAARKIEKKESVQKKTRTAEQNRRYGKNKLKSKSKANVKAKQNTKVVACVLCSFTMGMLLTYRYNMISEKNLKVQELKGKLAAVEATLLTKQIEVEQNTDLNYIEAYAKQQLGMQKPDKNQTIYIDTSKSINSIQINEQTSGVEQIVLKFKEMISKIF